jgi:hypothetical protein
MQYLVEVCEVSGAQRLVDLDGTGDFHSPMTSMSPFYEFSFEELKKLVESGAHFRIPTFANKAPFYAQTPVHGWENCNIGILGDSNCLHCDPKCHQGQCGTNGPSDTEKWVL